MDTLRVWVGYDPREHAAYEVTCESIRRHSSQPVAIQAVGMGVSSHEGMLWRPTERRVKADGTAQLWDVISDAPMSTGFSFARFLVPALAHYSGWAVFCDCDFLFRADIAELFRLADPAKAVQVVQHHYCTGLDQTKMDGQANPRYWRKNWSSLVLWNCGHPANKVVTPELVNTLTGRDLHGFTWLKDEEIGGLPFEWNWLELQPKAVHFTLGVPDMPGYERVAYADEYRAYLRGEKNALEPERREASHQEGGLDQGGKAMV